MSKGYLLDTNIAIAILVNEEIVIDFIQQASRDKMRFIFLQLQSAKFLQV